MTLMDLLLLLLVIAAAVAVYFFFAKDGKFADLDVIIVG